MKGIILLATLILSTILTGTLGVLIEHPRLAIAPEGSTAEFTCVIKNCDSCFIRWEAFDTETGEPVSGMTQPRVVAEGNCVTSTISIVAVNNAVVQCEENNRFAKTKRERYHYSKMALLIVEKEGSGAEYR